MSPNALVNSTILHPSSESSPFRLSTICTKLLRFLNKIPGKRIYMSIDFKQGDLPPGPHVRRGIG